MDFEKWLRTHGIDDGDGLEKGTRDVLRKIYEEEKAAAERSDKNLVDIKARTSTIINTGRAAVATANDAVRAEIMSLAAELVSDDSISAEDAQRKIADKVVELAKEGGTDGTGVADEQRVEMQAAIPADPAAQMSRGEIAAVFGEVRDDRVLYQRAGVSAVNILQDGGNLRSLAKDFEGKQGTLRIHEGDTSGGRPNVRMVTANSMNVAIQNIMTTLLKMEYDETLPITDALVTQFSSTAGEDTFPEVETEDGVRKVKEGDAYPILSGSDRDVKTSYVKYGAAIAQTRENSVFDGNGRITVHVTSLARQLRRYRDQFRLARILDYNGLDGRYIARPGNDNGTAVFYTASEDHRGNANLKASNALADETDINNAITLLDGMQLLDGTYITPAPKVLITASTAKATAWKIVNAIYAPSATSGQTLVPNPYGPQGMLSQAPIVVSHPLVATYAGAATTWFLGDPAKQFFEKVVWPVEVTPKMTGGEMALRDIIELWVGSFCVDMVALSNMFFIKNTA